MGCKGSKLDDQEVHALCRTRAELLALAVRHRYALADTDAALADSIESVAQGRWWRACEPAAALLRPGGGGGVAYPRSFLAPPVRLVAGI